MTSIINSLSLIVASFTDAWIETINDFRNVNAYQVASFTDAWIETLTPLDLLYANCRIFYRCVD